MGFQGSLATSSLICSLVFHLLDFQGNWERGRNVVSPV